MPRALLPPAFRVKRSIGLCAPNLSDLIFFEASRTEGTKTVNLVRKTLKVAADRDVDMDRIPFTEVHSGFCVDRNRVRDTTLVIQTAEQTLRVDEVDTQETGD